MKLLWVGIVIALVVWVLYRAAKRLSVGGLPLVGVSEERTRSLGLASLRETVQGLLAHLWHGTVSLFLPLGPGERTRHVVRRAYQNVLYRATELNAPRGRAQTPRQYVETLSALGPERIQDLQQITRIYEHARYSAEPPTERQAVAAEEAGKRIETTPRNTRPAQNVAQETPES